MWIPLTVGSPPPLGRTPLGKPPPESSSPVDHAPTSAQREQQKRQRAQEEAWRRSNAQRIDAHHAQLVQEARRAQEAQDREREAREAEEAERARVEAERARVEAERARVEAEQSAPRRRAEQLRGCEAARVYYLDHRNMLQELGKENKGNAHKERPESAKRAKGQWVWGRIHGPCDEYQIAEGEWELHRVWREDA
jgi:hypothetical protein